MRSLAVRPARLTCFLASLLFALLFLPAVAGAEPTLPDGFQDTTVFANLQEPTALRFAPDGRVFVAEKPGLIEVYEGIDDPTPEVFADLRTEAYDHGDRGLLGLALDPKFDEGRPYVYALYTYDHILGDPSPAPKWGTPGVSGDFCPQLKGADDCVVSGRLVRLTAAAGENHAIEAGGAPLEKVLVEGWCQQFSSHSIGDLQFGPEGALFASGGDGASFTSADFGQFGTPPNPCGDPPGGAGVELHPPDAQGGSLRSQNLSTLNGKVIRIDPDTGQGWPTNPLIGSPNENTRRVIAYGFRNPFRFAINPETDEVYVDNVGNSTDEEIDRFSTAPQSPYNSGWPCFEGDAPNPDFQNVGLDVCQSLYDQPGSTSPPFFEYVHEQPVTPEDECISYRGSAISGTTFYDGSSFPASYDHALFFADSVRRCIYVMFAGADGRPDPSTTVPFLTDGSLYPGVDIEVGPEGALYYAKLFGDEYDELGSIHRISYFSGNQPPVARLTATPSSSPGVLNAKFDASGSSDAEGEGLEYAWDPQNDGSYEAPTSNPVREETFADSQNHTVAVRVSDEQGAESVARVTVYPHDTPPEPVIVSPAESPLGSGIAGLHWRVGQGIEFEGVAEDAEDGALPDANLDWSSRLYHCPGGPTSCHAHPLQAFPAVHSGTLIAPEHDLPSHIELTFKATDARGLSASKTISLEPSAVQLGIESQPPGVTLTAGLLTKPGPFAFPAIEGSNISLSAPQTAQIGGQTYVFQGWSDGGARVHSLVADASATYTATFSASPVSSGGSSGEARPPAVGGAASLARPTLRAHPPKAAGKTARFVFGSATAGAGYACKLDGGPLVPCHAPRVYRNLKPGKHVFRVFAEAPGEGVEYSPAAVFRWRVL
ncbi:MAG TPA: PQQ-dependent sugar dehydrogenase [Solirubrobacterales bacterium]